METVSKAEHEQVLILAEAWKERAVNHKHKHEVVINDMRDMVRILLIVLKYIEFEKMFDKHGKFSAMKLISVVTKTVTNSKEALAIIQPHFPRLKEIFDKYKYLADEVEQSN